MSEQRGDVVKENARLREIRYRSNMALQIHGIVPDDPAAAIGTAAVAE
jgi:hypothetical protein